MSKTPRKSSKNAVTEAEILSLYNSGLSSNMIAKQNGINAARVSKILRNNGVGPREYRTCPDFIKRVLHALILAGFTYTEISLKTHIAHSYIREYVSQTEEIQKRSEELFRRKSNQAAPPSVPPKTVCSDRMISKFCKGFEDGAAGFSMIVTQLSASEEQMVYLFSIIDEKMLTRHNAKLEQTILAELAAGIPAIGASKKVGVSPSYVANIAKK